ncbi:hypothetical protein EYR36_000185 [Pleurotus pulmonarius]|nr:hypothetical protein EYR36_000185 [Pleurotus pulmonarius]
MGRGRPRIYHTEEDKIRANRAKSKRSYDKRRASSGTKKVTRYHASAETKGLLKSASPTKGLTSLDPTTIPGWLSLVAKVLDDFTATTRGSTRSYVEAIYQSYMDSRQKEVLNDPILELTGLQNTIRRCEAGLLQLAGYGNEYLMAENTGKNIGRAIACLDDILCHALCGYAEVLEMYESDLLLFQAL